MASPAFNSNPFFPVNTLALIARRDRRALAGVFERYVDEIYRRCGPNPKRWTTPRYLRAAFTESRLRPIDSGVERDPGVKDELMENTRASVERGTFGSPTFFVGDEIFFGKDRLRDVEEEIVRVNA